jgi:ABC-type uncharacterized transport system ATPase subunit
LGASAPSPTEAVLALDGVSKLFGPLPAVDGASLEIRRGEVFTLLGPSGCGKTTTLRLVAGLEHPDAGEIVLRGRVVASAARRVFVPPHKRNLGMVFQSYAIWPHMTVAENVAYPLELRGVKRGVIREKVTRVLELVGLSGLEKRAATLPGVILGLALLWLFLGVDVLKPLYGTTALLIVAGVIAGMPLGVQIIKSGLLQLGGELEEASRIVGASWWATYRRIVLRLMAPTLMAVAMITFVGAARNIGNFALLATSANRPLSILQLDYIAQRKFEEAVVVACIIMFISLAGALIARLLGLRGSVG